MARYFLASTAVGELFTVMMAMTLLSEKFFTKEGAVSNMDRKMQNMLVLYAIEEIENKDVTFDVMKEMKVINKLEKMSLQGINQEYCFSFCKLPLI